MDRQSMGFPVGQLTFERRAVGEHFSVPTWKSDNTKLNFSEGYVEIAGEGRTIEEEKEALQTIFAHKQIGGGCLSTGEHQEEIRFVGSPELICASLFTEELADNEVLIATGSERFNAVSGYGATMRFNGDYI